MRAKEIFAAALKATGMSQAEVARMTNQPPQSIGQKINVRESVRANEFFDILDAMGIDAFFSVRKTGEILMKEQRHGRHLFGVSDGVAYNTNDAELLASSFYADGTNEFGPDGRAQELYMDRKGRYFTAEYSNNEGERDRVRSVPANVAAAIIKQYGIAEKKTPV